MFEFKIYEIYSSFPVVILKELWMKVSKDKRIFEIIFIVKEDISIVQRDEESYFYVR